MSPAPVATFDPQIIAGFQATASVPPNVVLGVIGDVSHCAPTGCAVSTTYASQSAPSPLTAPAPWVSASYTTPLASCSFVAEYWSIALTAFAVGYGGGVQAPEFTYLAPYTFLAHSIAP